MTVRDAIAELLCWDLNTVIHNVGQLKFDGPRKVTFNRRLGFVTFEPQKPRLCVGMAVDAEPIPIPDAAAKIIHEHWPHIFNSWAELRIHRDDCKFAFLTGLAAAGVEGAAWICDQLKLSADGGYIRTDWINRPLTQSPAPPETPAP